MSNEENSNEIPGFDELKNNLEKVDILTKRLVYIIATKSKKQQVTPPNQDLYYKAAAKYFSEILSNPSKLIENQIKYYKSSLETWSDVQKYFLKQEMSSGTKSDRRLVIAPDTIAFRISSNAIGKSSGIKSKSAPAKKDPSDDDWFPL